MYEAYSDKRKQNTSEQPPPIKKIKNLDLIEELLVRFRQCLYSWDDLNKTAEELRQFTENIHDSSNFDVLLREDIQNIEHKTLLGVLELTRINRVGNSIPG
ncbi:7087_t:CDS:2 [Ambispora leptoticha]|uniref:7087_t:CDS:1 n=1 Tax=Ambispora leptoticha TaxID=144679 RepID=A0A9N9BFH2_9GLOM|nr:7087_t:CDS:2 [Ambispora leptoticha]